MDISFQVAYYKGEHVAFDIVPAVVEFEVNQGSVVIEEPFQVAGFSVYGKVINKKGVRLSVYLSVCLSVCWLIYAAGFGSGFRLRTQWLNGTVQKFSHCTESDSDSNPNCQLQDRNPSLYPSPCPAM